MMLVLPSKRILRPSDKPPFERTQRFGLDRDQWSAQNLVSCWLMNEGGGSTVYDLSRNGHNGTLVQTAQFAPCKFGSGLLLDGDSDYVDFGRSDFIEGLPGLSIVTWVRYDAIGSTDDIISNRSGGVDTLKFYRHGNGNLICALFTTGDASVSVTVEDALVDADIGKWFQVAMTYDGAKLTVYKNGLYGNSGALVGLTQVTDNNLWLGLGDSGYWAGAIDHMIIWNSALSASEVASLDAKPFQMIWRPRVMIVVPAAGGGETYVRTINDGLGISDAMGRTQALSRTITDGVGVADASDRTQVLTRTFNDAAGIADAISKAQGYARTIADTINVTDLKGWLCINGDHLEDYCGHGDNCPPENALNGTGNWYHFQPEETVDEHYLILDLGEVHNITKVRGRSNQVSDPTDIDIYVSQTNPGWDGDWGAAVATEVSTWQDTSDWVEIDVTDKLGRYIMFDIQGTEALPAGGDLLWGVSAPARPILDVYYDDSISRVVQYARTLGEALGLTDAATPLKGATRTISDDMGITDSVARTMVQARTVADAMGVTDDVTRVQVQLRTIADALGLTDQMTPGQILLISDVLGITDSMARTQAQIRTVADTLGITDDLTRIAAYVFTEADDIGIADAMLRVAVAIRTISDDVGITDERSVQHNVGGLFKAAWAFMVIRQSQN